MGFWDDPALKPAGGDYVKFENPGDSVAGTIINLGVKTWQDGDKSARITLDLDSGGTCILTASNAHLQRLLWSAKPQLGDHIMVRFDGEEKAGGGGFKRKVFTLEVSPTGKRDAAAITHQTVPTGRHAPPAGDLPLM